MPWICIDCGAVCDEPLRIDQSFDHAFGTESAEAIVCPVCGDGELEQARPCENPDCRGFRFSTEHLCRDCREDLLRRVTDFFDGLTEAEELTFDDWMDGNSIQSRKNWEV